MINLTMDFPSLSDVQKNIKTKVIRTKNRCCVMAITENITSIRLLWTLSSSWRWRTEYVFRTDWNKSTLFPPLLCVTEAPWLGRGQACMDSTHCMLLILTRTPSAMLRIALSFCLPRVWFCRWLSSHRMWW